MARATICVYTELTFMKMARATICVYADRTNLSEDDLSPGSWSPHTRPLCPKKDWCQPGTGPV